MNRAGTAERGAPITYEHFARAIAEFEFSLVFTDAPIDRFARGDEDAMTAEQKEGALLFFGKAGCVACHAVAGQSNEMFSDFSQDVIGVPQVVPTGGNVTFDGPGGLLDRRALPEHQRHLVPRNVPSGRSIPTFEFERDEPAGA
jgi:cytochrome c peroxidase